MADRLVIVGAGGHGRELYDLVIAIGGFEVLGFVDDGAPDVAAIEKLEMEVLGTTDVLESLGADVSVVLAIGSAVIRAEAAALIGERAAQAPVLVHPDATVGSRTRLGPGTVVAPGARLTVDITTGSHCYIGPNATIGHDCRFESFATVFNGAVVSGSVHLGRAASVGAGAAVRQGLHLGAGAVVGLGAAVVHDVPEGATVVGVPARRVGRWPDR